MFGSFWLSLRTGDCPNCLKKKFRDIPVLNITNGFFGKQFLCTIPVLNNPCVVTGRDNAILLSSRKIRVGDGGFKIMYLSLQTYNTLPVPFSLAQSQYTRIVYYQDIKLLRLYKREKKLNASVIQKDDKKILASINLSFFAHRQEGISHI